MNENSFADGKALFPLPPDKSLTFECILADRRHAVPSLTYLYNS